LLEKKTKKNKKSEALKISLLNKIPKALPRDGQMVEKIS